MQTSVTLSARAFPGLRMAVWGGDVFLSVAGGRSFPWCCSKYRKVFCFPVFSVACMFETRVAVFGRLNLTLMRLVWSRSLGHFIFEVDNTKDKLVSFLVEILER